VRIVKGKGKGKAVPVI